MVDIRADGDDVLLAVKAVPGASRTKVAGVLGNRVKITVAAAPEKGKANQAITDALAKLCDLPSRSVSVERGTTNPMKTIRLRATTVEQVQKALGL
ncbi:MAG: DUF167 domain-containing protein [Phycisphaerales bacterium]|nr:DUF167 domain-containing protein [Phycisphaerales bacterium]